jgi:hypothetical protein
MRFSKTPSRGEPGAPAPGTPRINNQADPLVTIPQKERGQAPRVKETAQEPLNLWWPLLSPCRRSRRLLSGTQVSCFLDNGRLTAEIGGGSIFMRAFAPARRVTLVSAKVTKTMFACAWPLQPCSEARYPGCLVHHPESRGLRNSLRGAKPPLRSSSLRRETIRYRNSAAQEVGKTKSPTPVRIFPPLTNK